MRGIDQVSLSLNFVVFFLMYNIEIAIDLFHSIAVYHSAWHIISAQEKLVIIIICFYCLQ